MLGAGSLRADVRASGGAHVARSTIDQHASITHGWCPAYQVSVYIKMCLQAHT